jgi:hypothetical protein
VEAATQRGTRRPLVVCLAPATVVAGLAADVPVLAAFLRPGEANAVADPGAAAVLAARHRLRHASDITDAPLPPSLMDHPLVAARVASGRGLGDAAVVASLAEPGTPAGEVVARAVGPWCR